MQDRNRITHPTSVSYLLVVAALALPFAACNSGSNGKGDKTAPTATASPPTGFFAGPSLAVTLAAMDDKDPDPDIYYTTDLSKPTTAGTLYSGPITVTETTVVKFLAVDNSGNDSGVLLAGYTQANNPVAMELAVSGHGNIVGEPFRHWDEDGEVSTSCARCHTGPGFNDYAVEGVTDAPAELPLGLDCDACHDSTVPFTLYDDLGTYAYLEPVTFPSDDEGSLWGASNMCATCHQGRESGYSIDEDIAANPAGPYSFVNIHYYAAAATFFGAETHGGYQYDGMTYAGRNTFPSHEATERDCVGCHMRGAEKDHTFEPDLTRCQTCHSGASFETLGGSPAANYTAVTVTRGQLLDEIQNYALDVLGQPIAYSSSTYPYWFYDLNGNGIADPNEATFSNGYKAFDASLLKAAYNYQAALKDPNGFIHNGTYLRQLIQDSVADLGGAVSIPAPGRAGWDADGALKSEQWHTSGHGISTSEPFHHWDEDGEVSSSCAKCHSSPGFNDYVADGSVDGPAPLGTLVECAACHIEYDLFADPATKYDDTLAFPALEPVLFPSGDTQTFGNASNICMTCHQGRESGVSVETATPNTTVQSPVDYDSYSFINRHYFAEAAILYGADVNAAYEYAGQPYDGQNTFPGHGGGLNDCVACHMRGIQDHFFKPKAESCAICHTGVTDFADLGLPFGATNVDYDGDGMAESFQGEIDGMKDTLLAGIYDYSHTGLPQSSPVVYGPGSYPYWFKDLDDDGVLDPDEATFTNGYKDFDKPLLEAAFNYHSAQDPGGDIHNYRYVMQSIYDSADNLDDGVFNLSVIGMRP